MFDSFGLQQGRAARRMVYAAGRGRTLCLPSASSATDRSYFVSRFIHIWADVPK
jgi:hypothetical protein